MENVLRENEELIRLRNAVEESGEVIFMTDRDGLITYVNPEFTRLYGYHAEEVVGVATPRILKSGFMEQQDYEMFWETLLSKAVVKGELINRCKDGSLVTIEGSANPILDPGGEIVGFLAIQRDITERKRAEEEIKQRNMELAALNKIITSISQSLDLNHIIDHALDVVLDLEILGEGSFGMLFMLDKDNTRLSLAAQRGVPAGHPCLLDAPQVGECLCGLAIQSGEVIVVDSCWEDERHTRRWEGTPIHKDIIVPLKARGKTLGALNLRLSPDREITENDVEMLKSVAGQISVAIENARLRELRERAIIEERERIARELHDGLSQLLGYVNTKAMAVRLMLLNRQFEAANKNLQQLEEAARSLFVDVRTAILGLKMADQHGVSLALGLKEYVTQFSRLSGLPVEMDLAPGAEELRLGVEQELHLFRIAQEALTNIRRHASATKAWVHMHFSENDLVLAIVDNGIGFNSEDIEKDRQNHFGLSMMRERAEAIGAALEIDTTPNCGTRVSARLKVREG